MISRDGSDVHGNVRLGERIAAPTAPAAEPRGGTAGDVDAGRDGAVPSLYLTEQIKVGRHYYAQQYPDRDRAHRLVAAAERRGEIIRPANCERCGHTRKLDAHHDDYSQPLTVRWLCRPCHTHVHPKTQKNIGPVWAWPLQATHNDMALAMRGARDER